MHRFRNASFSNTFLEFLEQNFITIKLYLNFYIKTLEKKILFE